jgi:Recombinase zinc beta ribbon domain
VPAEHLRVVSDARWSAAHRLLSDRREVYKRVQAGSGESDGRGVRAHYLLSGFARCSACGASMQVVSRKSSGGRRLFRYICGTYWNRGSSVCANGRMVEMETADEAIRQLLATEVLRPAVIEAALTRAVALLEAGREPQTRDARRASLRRALDKAERDLQNLVETATRGGAVPAILDALNGKDAERLTLSSELATLDRDGGTVALDTDSLKTDLRAMLGDWHGIIRGNVPEAKLLLRTMLEDRITCRPHRGVGGALMYRLQVPIAFDRILERVVPGLQDRVTSPTGFEPVFWP